MTNMLTPGVWLSFMSSMNDRITFRAEDGIVQSIKEIAVKEEGGNVSRLINRYIKSQMVQHGHLTRDAESSITDREIVKWFREAELAGIDLIKEVKPIFRKKVKLA